ncbi:MAG TPA: hypothetical protein VFV50_18450, partial [Bdellovibrionales bacterium]|nr:hypothetical protein [Bdellovibrionales bacterium]
MSALISIFLILGVSAFAANGPNCSLPGDAFIRQEINRQGGSVSGLVRGSKPVTGDAAVALSRAREGGNTIQASEDFVEYARLAATREEASFAMQNAVMRARASGNSARAVELEKAHSRFGRGASIEEALADVKPVPGTQPVRASSPAPGSATQASSGPPKPAEFSYSRPYVRQEAELPVLTPNGRYEMTRSYRGQDVTTRLELIEDNGTVAKFKVTDSNSVFKRDATVIIDRSKPDQNPMVEFGQVHMRSSAPRPNAWGSSETARSQALTPLKGKAIDIQTTRGATISGDLVKYENYRITIRRLK